MHAACSPKRRRRPPAGCRSTCCSARPTRASRWPRRWPSSWRGSGRNVPYAYNRKEAKDHGEGGTLVGAPVARPRAGDRRRDLRRHLDARVDRDDRGRRRRAVRAGDRARPAGARHRRGRRRRAVVGGAVRARSELGLQVVAIATLGDLLAVLRLADDPRSPCTPGASPPTASGTGCERAPGGTRPATAAAPVRAAATVCRARAWRAAAGRRRRDRAGRRRSTPASTPAASASPPTARSPSALHREQTRAQPRRLGAGGWSAPTLTADERAETEAAEQRLRANARRGRTPCAATATSCGAFPTRPRTGARARRRWPTLKQSVQASQARIAALARERKSLLDEAEFYQGRTLPLRAAAGARRQRRRPRGAAARWRRTSSPRWRASTRCSMPSWSGCAGCGPAPCPARWGLLPTVSAQPQGGPGAARP